MLRAGRVDGLIGVPVALGTAGRGAVVGLASDDLNVNEVSWPAGEGVGEHRNDVVDVLLVVVDGAMTVVVDGEPYPLASRQLMVVPKGALRSLTAGRDGVRYVTCHRRRPPLQLL